MDNATEVNGGVPFRSRIRNPKAVNMMSENGLNSLTSDITKFANAQPHLSPKGGKKLSTK